MGEAHALIGPRNQIMRCARSGGRAPRGPGELGEQHDERGGGRECLAHARAARLFYAAVVLCACRIARDICYLLMLGSLIHDMIVCQHCFPSLLPLHAANACHRAEQEEGCCKFRSRRSRGPCSDCSTKGGAGAKKDQAREEEGRIQD